MIDVAYDRFPGNREPPAFPQVLVRYGVIPEVLRCACPEPAPELRRGARVVVRTPRGTELGLVLQVSAAAGTPREDVSDFGVVRLATPADEADYATLADAARREFPLWQTRIAEWGLQLELVDLEWLLDRSKLILYVLAGRGPEATKLALFAAAEGWGTLEVQPVAGDGIVSLPRPDHGCGCGSHGCHP